ncbi:hypothetical protein GE21DRAFT_5409 [Neurospora crassa]|uniref:Uncharacterized protein n=1 Tax=Neurospora crassa (strain ATCC 24698 / 74-OR23-1A / CBS 708.71 / DSM 1257 / FGSC 987) TaxID=367110 RepID=V5ILW5_NEUCR|nr:uncharacterized protein NCU04950 [Neurospora crassa OR74A]ESA42783.1 hypothetical protein, variant [Neurospora crassa OR74A]KHE81587.1 hypothetical protein GE21DRAFT_5409 [Neurospora crassa]|eukprot:XP_011394123.1 uncharacterized protein NCU04950 [Neurospora crassa OR74A]
MCTQAITQSLCSHCKELLLEVTTEERCPKVIQAQAYTFSCGAKKTTKAREYPRKCVACIKKEREEEEEEGSDKNGRSRMGERSVSAALLLSPFIAGRGIRCHSCPSVWQLGGRSR